MKDKYISYYELLGMIKEGNIPKRIYVKIASYGMYYVANYDGEDFNYYELQDKDVIDENYHVYLSECFLESSMFEKCIQVLDEEDEIEIPQEFLKDVNPESEIVLIKDNLGHDKGYENSIGFITDKNCLEEDYVFAFDKRANRWRECGFDKDEYIRTGLFVSDLIYKPFKAEPIEEEFEYIDKLDIEDNAMNRSERYIRKSNNKLVTLSVPDYVLANKINQLIKNQKKIIERLK